MKPGGRRLSRARGERINIGAQPSHGRHEAPKHAPALFGDPHTCEPILGEAVLTMVGVRSGNGPCLSERSVRRNAPFIAVPCLRRLSWLLGSLLALLASAAGLVTLGSSYILGEVSAVAFAVSLFILVCATEART